MSSSTNPQNDDIIAVPETVTKALPFRYQFAAGAIAGVTEIACMYPLDVVKTRFQLQTSKSAGQEYYTSILDCFKKIIKKEGFRRLYRGIAAPILIEAPKRATKFAANEQYGQLYRKLFEVDKMTQFLSIITGVSAGVTEAFVIVPFELVKIRLQDASNAGRYKNTSDAIKKILQQEGAFGFYKGIESTIFRNAFWNGGYFGIIHYIRELLPPTDNPSSHALGNFVAGAIGGTFGTILNTPFDVAKTRIQNQGPDVVQKYRWVIPAVTKIFREEGFRALYKGFVPKVLRLGPGGGILLVVFDKVTGWFREHLNL